MTSNFTQAFDQLLGLRTHYEDLRTSGAPLADRAAALQQLHDKRAELAAPRALTS